MQMRLHNMLGIFDYLVSVSIIVTAAIGLFAPQLILTVARPAYLPAATYVFTLATFYGPLSLAAALFSIPNHVYGRAHLTSIPALIAAAVNIMLNLWLMPRFGVWAATITTLIAGIIQVVLAYFPLRKTRVIPYRLIQWMLPISCFTAILIINTITTLNTSVFDRFLMLLALITSLVISGMLPASFKLRILAMAKEYRK